MSAAGAGTSESSGEASYGSILGSKPLRTALRYAVLLITVVLATQTFVAIGWLRPVVVAGDSMAPAYESGQRLTIRRWATPRRWDVVVLRSPTDAGRLVVKRVVGLPGERVRFRDGRVWIDGAPAEPRNPDPVAGVFFGAMGNPEWLLANDEWLVVGDNQPVSIDSRNWDHPAGVPTRLIVGVVVR